MGRFLRACAIQNFLSTMTVSVIERRFYAEIDTEGADQPSVRSMDSFLDTLSNVTGANSSQDLSWRLLTVDKLDRVGSLNSSMIPIVSTKPNENDIRQNILRELHHFQGSSDHRLQNKLAEIAEIATTLWSALRKDSCRIEIDFEPSVGDRNSWDFVDYTAIDSHDVPGSPTALDLSRLPSTSFALFPRVMGFFGPDDANPRLLHVGVALASDSPAFKESLEEIDHLDYATNQLKRGGRRFSTQSSPISDSFQRKLPPVRMDAR